MYLCLCKHAEVECQCLPHVASCPPCFFPISISDLAIPMKVPTHCVSTPGPVCLIAGRWTAINPWWRGWGIFMSACQQWHDTLWGWIICLLYTGFSCWVQFTARMCVCVGACTVSCVWVRRHSDTLRSATGGMFYIPHWHLTNLPLTTEVGVSPPHAVSCMASLYCFLSVFMYTFFSSSNSSPSWLAEEEFGHEQQIAHSKHAHYI